MLRRVLWLAGVLSLLGCASACGGSGASAGTADPGTTVERYMEAKVARDETALRSLLCAEMESLLPREVSTFETVSDATIEDMACQQVGDSDTVSCQGRIVALYGTEQTEFPLTNYRVTQEDGEWKWCGEAP
jgi:hypothetical protein